MDAGGVWSWRAIGCSVRGASHTRSGLPNQDAIHWSPRSGEGLPLFVALSDGHGSAKSFRSHLGAMLAVVTATEALKEFAAGLPDAPTLSAVKREAEERLPREIVRRWREEVERDLADNPLGEELDRLAEREGERARRSVENNPYTAYGATLVATLVARDFLLYLQLGDGDILTISDTNEVSRPLPRDERLFANETTSLSSKDAWRDARVGFQVVSGPPPALILLATDGYPNSFANDTGFLRVGSDLLDMLREDGLDAVNANLETWLAEASEAGSGDDISLGLICRIETRD